MSHFSVLCIMGTGLDNMVDVEARLDEMLAPYDENISVAPYRVYGDASSRGRGLHAAVPEVVEARCGPWPKHDFDAMRREFQGLVEGTPAYAKVDARWKAAWAEIEAYETRVGEAFTPAEYAELLNSHYYKDGEPDADYLRVDEQGAYRMSTYNPKSKWDWWVIGGRWGGLLPLKPDKDGAIGSPPAFGGPNDEQVDGKHADVALAGSVVLEGLERKFFAMLTPEGWEEPAKMGWWGITHDRTEAEDDWNERVRKSLEALDPRTMLVVVDAHI